MQRLSAILWLTVKAAFRFRLVLVLAGLLIGAVILLPLMIRDDGTARGFTQILLTYTLSLITALLGFATLWLACGTLARDVEEAQIQMVAVKPVGRWQIWLGKWLGVLTVNALLLALSAGAVFCLMQWRARKLPLEQQRILYNEVLVARGSAKMPIPDFSADVEAELKRRIQTSPVPITDPGYVRKQLQEQAKAELQIVRPGYMRTWQLDFGVAQHFLRDQPLYVRAKFNAAETSGTAKTYLAHWEIGEPDRAGLYRTNLSLAADTFHEFIVPPNLFNEKGVLTISFANPNDTALLFALEDGFEVLYPEGSFGLNFVRGCIIIFLWLALLAALGLAASSFLSFPVAAFCSLGVLAVGLFSGTIALVLEQGTILEVNHNTGVADQPALIDYVALPVFRVLFKLINLIKGFSPIDALSTGRSISWSELSQAFGQIGLLLCGLLCAIGMIIFSRRELAAAQTNQ